MKKDAVSDREFSVTLLSCMVGDKLEYDDNNGYRRLTDAVYEAIDELDQNEMQIITRCFKYGEEIDESAKSVMDNVLRKMRYPSCSKPLIIAYDQDSCFPIEEGGIQEFGRILDPLIEIVINNFVYLIMSGSESNLYKSALHELSITLANIDRICGTYMKDTRCKPEYKDMIIDTIAWHVDTRNDSGIIIIEAIIALGEGSPLSSLLEDGIEDEDRIRFQNFANYMYVGLPVILTDEEVYDEVFFEKWLRDVEYKFRSTEADIAAEFKSIEGLMDFLKEE